MPSPNRTALVLGATGMVGKAILDELLHNANYSAIIAVTRRPLDRPEPGYKNVVVDFAHLDQHADRLRGDDVFCALGTTIRHAGSKDAFRRIDYNFPMALAEIALKNGASGFYLVSAVGANADSSVFYLRVKGELENALAKMSYSSANFFRPAMLEGERENRRLREELGVVFSHLISFALIGPWRKYRAVKATSVAKAMLEIANRKQTGIRVFESNEIQSIADGTR